LFAGKSHTAQNIYGLLQPQKGEYIWARNRVLGPDYLILFPAESYMKIPFPGFDLMPFTNCGGKVSQFLSVLLP